MVLVDDARYFPVVKFLSLATHTQLTCGMVIWWLLVAWDLTFDLCVRYTCSVCSWWIGSIYWFSHS